MSNASYVNIIKVVLFKVTFTNKGAKYRFSANAFPLVRWGYCWGQIIFFYLQNEPNKHIRFLESCGNMCFWFPIGNEAIHFLTGQTESDAYLAGYPTLELFQGKVSFWFYTFIAAGVAAKLWW